MPDIVTAIAGGLIGAGMTALATYKVQNLLAIKRRQEQEQRIAYVRLVQVSEILAIEELVRKVAKIYAEPFLKQDPLKVGALVPTDGKYNFGHGLAAGIAGAIKENVKPGEPLTQLDVLRDGFIHGLTKLLEFGMTPSELAELPRPAILAYVTFSQYASYTAKSIEVIIDAFAKGQTEILTADFLFSVFQTVEVMLDNARQLQDALIEKGAVSPKEAKLLHSKHFLRYHKQLMAHIENAPKIAAAKDAVAALAKESN